MTYFDWAQVCFQTLEASNWELFKARLFGYKITGKDEFSNICTGYLYNGKIYITEYKEKIN